MRRTALAPALCGRSPAERLRRDPAPNRQHAHHDGEHRGQAEPDGHPPGTAMTTTRTEHYHGPNVTWDAGAEKSKTPPARPWPCSAAPMWRKRPGSRIWHR